MPVPQTVPEVLPVTVNEKLDPSCPRRCPTEYGAAGTSGRAGRGGGSAGGRSATGGAPSKRKLGHLRRPVEAEAAVAGAPGGAGHAVAGRALVGVLAAQEDHLDHAALAAPQEAGVDGRRRQRRVVGVDVAAPDRPLGAADDL